MSYAFAEQPPIENVQRGTVFALVAAPVGIVVWIIVWSFGFIVSIVGFGVAWLALFLYRFGSGGIVSRTGAIRVAIITVVTLLVAIYAGLIADGVSGFSQASGLSAIETLTSSQFWPAFNSLIADPAVWAEIVPSVGLALLFGVLGCFSLLRGAFMTTRVAAAEPLTASPAAPLAQPFAWPVDQAPPFPTEGALTPTAAPTPPPFPVPAPSTPPPTMPNGKPYNPDQR